MIFFDILFKADSTDMLIVLATKAEITETINRIYEIYGSGKKSNGDVTFK